jgi:hypothetical protein
MSRAKPVDNSASVSLFPFLAVLLCTMGALLVVLVAMTRSARDAALRRAAANPPPAVTDEDSAARKEIDEVNQFVSQLDQVRSEALRKLREDQLRLSHLEDHMRRLQDQLEKLQIAAAELEALEGEHYDDRQQAEREVQRLQRLIATTREAIDALKQQQKTKKRCYALVPYEGPNGTTRRPIYLECRQGEVIFQPEGVRITRDDLRPPLGTGNPLASALRAARDHLIRLHAEEGQNRDSEPYPLVVVRPSGATMYGLVQRAIQSGDFQFGYELAEEDWELKYPAADPQLAIVEQRAVDLARMRRRALAAAAPRAYSHPALAAAGRFEFADDGEGFGAGGDGDAEEAASDGLPGMGNVAGGIAEHDGVRGAENEMSSMSGRPGGPAERRDAEAPPAGMAGAPNAANNGEMLRNGRPEGPAAAGSLEQLPGGIAAGNAGPPQSIANGGGGSTPGSNTVGQIGSTPVITQQLAPDRQDAMELTAARGKDWALKNKKPRAVPVRRTIQVIVRNDQLAILSDEQPRGGHLPAGKTIPLKPDTGESIDEFVAAIQAQIDGWGMAGDGLYWRPVLSLHVGPDGHRRAQDLARLLKNSGLELQPAAAQLSPQGNSREPRGR